MPPHDRRRPITARLGDDGEAGVCACVSSGLRFPEKYSVRRTRLRQVCQASGVSLILQRLATPSPNLRVAASRLERAPPEPRRLEKRAGGLRPPPRRWKRLAACLLRARLGWQWMHGMSGSRPKLVLTRSRSHMRRPREDDVSVPVPLAASNVVGRLFWHPSRAKWPASDAARSINQRPTSSGGAARGLRHPASTHGPRCREELSEQLGS